MTPIQPTSIDPAPLRYRVEEMRAEFIRQTARRIARGIATITRRIVRG